MATYESNLDGKSNIGAGGGGSVIVEDEGGVVTGGPFTTLDFVGAGVTASDGGGGTATITIPGGGGGTDTYTAPNEYFIDPNLGADAAKRQYPTISAALTAAGSASPVLVRLVEGANHVWDGSGLDPAADLVIWSAGGNATLQFDETTTVSTDGELRLQQVNIESLGIASTGSFTVNTAPLAAGDEIEVDFFTFTGVAGPRTPGFQDWDASLGTVELLAAEIAAAINDIENGGGGDPDGHGVTAVAVGAVVQITANIPGSFGDFINLASTTTPGGGITDAGMSGGLDALVDFAVLRLTVEGCTGNLIIGIPDSPTPAYRRCRVAHSDLDFQFFAGGDTTRGVFEIVDCTIRAGTNGLNGGLWFHDSATTEWEFYIRRSLVEAHSSADPLILANAELLGVYYQASTLVLYTDFDHIIQTGGEFRGPVWESCRILDGTLTKSGGGWTFGDVGFQSGLEIEYIEGSGLLPVDAPGGTVARSNTEDGGGGYGFGQVTFSGDLLQWRGANNSVLLGDVTISSNGVPEWLPTITEAAFGVNISTSPTLGVYSVQGRVHADTGTSSQSAVWDIDALLRIDASPDLVNILKGSAPTVFYETTPGQFTLQFAPAGNVTVLNSPVTPGVTLTINGVPLVAVAVARTPGSDNFNGALGSPALIATEIAAAINDAANSFGGVALAEADGAVVTVASAVPTFTLAESGSDLELYGLGFSLIVTRNSGSGSTRLSADTRIRAGRIFT